MEIIVRQVSGLGNQLFQYAAGLYYAKHHGADVQMSIDHPRNAVSHGYRRPFLLSHFSISMPFRDVSSFDRLLFTEKPLLKTISRVVRKALRVEIVNEPRRYTFMQSLPVDPNIRSVYLVGYWQTYQVVNEVEETLRRELKFKEIAKGKDYELLKQIEQSKNAVSLHIRRGDYTLAAEGNIALPIDYSVQAVKILLDRLKDPTFFVFSDDMDFAKKHLPPHARMVFVDHNNAITSHEDLRLMSACSHHIIANSTFSWWGAWINPNPNKIVIAPRHWLRTRDSYFPDLIPPEWILIDTNNDSAE